MLFSGRLPILSVKLKSNRSDLSATVLLVGVDESLNLSSLDSHVGSSEKRTCVLAFGLSTISQPSCQGDL